MNHYLLGILLPCFLALVLWNARPAVAGWSYRWRSLNASSPSGLCTMQTSDLADHFKEALVDIILYQTVGEFNSTDVQETCRAVQNTIDLVSRNLGTSSICLNPHGVSELLVIRQYLQLLQRTGQPAVVASTLAVTDYRSPSGASQRGFFDGLSTPVLTSGPSETELVSAAYQYIVAMERWSYVGLVWEADLGADRLSQLLQATARSDRRVCFPLSLRFQSDNVTNAAKALKDFVYTTKSLSRFTVVYAGSGTAFLRLWNLVSGSDSTFSDPEKRYQFVLIGDVYSSYHQMSDTINRKNIALGTVFIFPGILDPDPGTDELRILFNNITSDPRSMGRFVELRDTHSRLKSLKDATSSVCSWSDADSVCYQLALRYDFLALSLAALLAHGTPSLSTMTDMQQLQQRQITLSALRTNITILESFTKQNYTTYSMKRGLQHSTRGYWQPIVKIYQSQLQNGVSYSLVKLGELRIAQAGMASQAYEFDVSSNKSQFYLLASGRPEFPAPATNFLSECPLSCPECDSSEAKQFIQYREGDIYLGILTPIFDKSKDVFDCTDGTFRSKKLGGYEFAMAFKFIVDLVNALSQDSALPPGFDAAKVDQQFLLGVKDLLQRVNARYSKRLRLGYVVVDSCYSPSCAVKRLGSLLDGTLGVVPGFDFTKVVGFVGDLGSSQTVAASQLLKMYNLPLITFGSTATNLSDVDQYPYVLRTVSSDTLIIEAMVTILKHLKVDFISVLHAPTAYGLSLREQMISTATREGICISNMISIDCGNDASCKRNVILTLKATKARYVPFLGSLTDLRSLLNYSQVETDFDYVTLLTTESVGVSDAAFVGKNNVGLGTLSLKLESSPSPAFSAFINYTLTRIPPNANSISKWDRLYFEDAQQCYMPGSFVRNQAFTQPCRQSQVESHPITDLESRVPFAIEAASTLVLGTLHAMSYACSRSSSPEPACPEYFSTSDFSSLQQRTNHLLYGSQNRLKPQGFNGNFNGSAWSYQKVFDDRMGLTPFSIWQYRKTGSAEFSFVQVGRYNGVNASTFSESVEALMSMERSGVSGSGAVASTASCRSRAICASDASQCINRLPPSTQLPPPAPSAQLGYLGFLFIPGFLFGFLSVCVFIAIARRRFKDNDGVYDSPPEATLPPDSTEGTLGDSGFVNYSAELNARNPQSGSYASMSGGASQLQMGPLPALPRPGLADA